jgi:hypothetical protein
MGIIFRDYFNDSDGVLLKNHVNYDINLTGNNWSDVNDYIKIVSNEAVRNKTSGADDFNSFFNIGQLCEKITLRLYFTSVYDGRWMIRRQDSTHFYALQAHSSGDFRLCKDGVGPAAQVQGASWSPVNGTWYDIQILDTGTGIQIFLNGTLKIDYNTTTYATSYGIGPSYWTGCAPRWDSVAVEVTLPLPTWIASYPKAGTIAKTSCQILTKTDIAGTAYFVCLPLGADLPSPAQIKAGTDVDDIPLAAGKFGSVALTANTEATMNATGLIAGTDYQIYAVAENLDAFLQTVVGGFEFTTLPGAPPKWIAGYPAAGAITKTIAEILLKADDDCTTYFVCLPFGANAPTSAQVKAGKDANNNTLAANLRGNISLTELMVGSVNVTGLVAATYYDFYVVAENADSEIQSAPVKFNFHTDFDNKTILKKSLLRVKTEIEFKLNLGTALDTAVDVPLRYVQNIGDITEKLSKSAVNSGGVLLPSLTIKLDNRRGLFSRDSGYFKNGFINGSTLKITTQYIDADGNEITPAFVYTGLVKYASCEWDRVSHIFSATIYPASNLLATEKIQPGTLSHTTFKNICYQILHRAPFTKYLTVSLSNFDLGWDVAAIDSYSVMTNKKVKEVLDEIMLLTGSIYYVDYSGNFIIEPITPVAPAAVCTLRAQDIEKVSSEKYDWKGQYTALKWDDGTNAVQRVEMTYPDRELYQYDYVELVLTQKYITDTTNREMILTNLLALYKFLKREVVLSCKWNPDIIVNRYIALDVPREAISGDEFLTWNDDSWNDGKFWGLEQPGISFSSTDLWRVVEIKRDSLGTKMTLTLVQLHSDDEA